MGSEQTSYAAAWARYRRIRLVTILLIVTFPVPPMLVTGILTSVVGDAGGLVMVPAFLVWIGVVVFAAIKWSYFPCPRCGKRFQRKAGWHTQRCASCGLVRFAETEAEAAPKAYPEQHELEAAAADPSYAAAWKTYHRLQALRSPWILAGAILVPAVLVPQFGSQAVALVWVVWAFGWFVVYATSRVRLRAFRCPRCKQRFHGGVDITKAEWCNHCRLRLYALSDPDAKTALR